MTCSSTETEAVAVRLQQQKMGCILDFNHRSLVCLLTATNSDAVNNLLTRLSCNDRTDCADYAWPRHRHGMATTGEDINHGAVVMGYLPLYLSNAVGL